MASAPLLYQIRKLVIEALREGESTIAIDKTIDAAYAEYVDEMEAKVRFQTTPRGKEVL